MSLKARWRQAHCKHTQIYRAWRDNTAMRRPGWACRCTLCGKEIK